MRNAIVMSASTKTSLSLFFSVDFHVGGHLRRRSLQHCCWLGMRLVSAVWFLYWQVISGCDPFCVVPWWKFVMDISFWSGWMPLVRITYMNSAQRQYLRWKCIIIGAVIPKGVCSKSKICCIVFSFVWSTLFSWKWIGVVSELHLGDSCGG